MASRSFPIMRPHSAPIYDPQRSDVTSDAWPFDKGGEFKFSNLAEVIEEIHESQADRAETTNRPADVHCRKGSRRSWSVPIGQNNHTELADGDISQHRRKSSRLSWSAISCSGDSQLIAPTYSASKDLEASHYHTHGPPSQPPMELISSQHSDTEEESCEPAGEGVLAWLHSLIGFLIIFNAQ